MSDLPQVDKEGFLRSLSDWTPPVAELLAENEAITLTQAHWEIILMVRSYYEQYQISPAMRVLVKLVGRELGAQKGKSIYLLSLFPNSPAKLISKIAGLPKPTNCD